MYKDVAITPFVISAIITKAPHLEPKTLNVLVAPGFPLPNWRISMPKTALLTQIDVGMEPIRKQVQ